jgi:hypothetical protein
MFASADSFPPYRLMERDYVDRAKDKSEKLERLYHIGQEKSWDGREVLRDLLREHGGITIPREQRESIARIFSIILWGELAAWNVSLDIALALEEVEPKMAAVSQAFDEARHFYVMRDYLHELGIPLPPLDNYSRVVLREILEAKSVLQKLIGMQLLVETNAVALFRMVGRAKIEPVLSGLMPYYERDEARHVGLGVLYLPKLLEKISRVEALRLGFYQFKILQLLVWATHYIKPDFDRLGLDVNETSHYFMRYQVDLFSQIGKYAADGKEPLRGIYDPSPGVFQKVNAWAIDRFFPAPGTELPRWQKAIVDGAHSISVAGERLLAWG